MLRDKPENIILYFREENHKNLYKRIKKKNFVFSVHMLLSLPSCLAHKMPWREMCGTEDRGRKGETVLSDCLITSRGATRARSMAAMLSAAGLPARIVRPPAEVSEEGCSYAVAVARQLVPRAAAVLRAGKLPPRRIFCPASNGRYKEHGGL